MFKPVHTERSLREVSRNKYTFKVPCALNKNQIREFVEKAWPVNVIKVQTAITHGKTYRTGKVGRSQKLDTKKAVVTLKAGQKIDLFEQTA